MGGAVVAMAVVPCCVNNFFSCHGLPHCCCCLDYCRCFRVDFLLLWLLLGFVIQYWGCW